VLLLVLMLHFLFTRVMTRRIDNLKFAMTQARQGDLKRRVAPGAHDELGTIARGFNEMMEEFERASMERDRLLEEQKGFNQQLQDRIAEATRDLSVANERLSQLNQDLLETQRRLTYLERKAVAMEMAATFAHEIGSPISAISTHLQLLLEDKTTPHASRNRLQLIQDQVNRITGFVEEMLAETRMAAQPTAPIQLNMLLNQLLHFLEQHLLRHRVRVETHFDSELPEIESNAQQLQQVFLNLFNNACDAMPEGGTLTVRTGIEPASSGKRFVFVIVSDDGVGIPTEKQERIFEPFFSTKALHRGTGLGLTIAARIVRQYEGTIAFQSIVGKGTTFTIRFPATLSEPSAGPVVPEGGEPIERYGANTNRG
jgi:signal transduction histidine kinase